jgi:choline dehydrogenase-like flavoprotein
MGNSSGLVGHYVMDSVKSGAMLGVVPVFENRERIDEDGAGGSHMTIPRFNYKRKNDYYGGYFILTGGGFGREVRSSRKDSLWGAALKRQIRQEYGSTISLRSYGERVPHFDNSFEIDPHNRDPYGIPQVRFRVAHRDNDLKMMEDMYGWMENILRGCGAEILPYKKYLEPLGDATHECGAARMGADPRTSVLNAYCQSHDVKNLFVTDGSCFVSLPGTHGITTMMMALSWRASDYLAELMRKREI